MIGICIGTLLLSGMVFANQTDKTDGWEKGNNSIVISNKKRVVTDKLPAIEVKSNYISPTDGVGIDNAKELISHYLIEQGYKGDVKRNIAVKEITIQQAWEVSKMQIYSVKLGYVSLDGVAVIFGGKVTGVISGMPTKAVYLADINNDKRYEVCTNTYSGSGLIDLRIGVLDAHNLKQYELSKRGEYDVLLAVDEKSNDLVVYQVETNHVNTEDKVLHGKLSLNDNQLIIVDK